MLHPTDQLHQATWQPFPQPGHPAPTPMTPHEVHRFIDELAALSASVLRIIDVRAPLEDVVASGIRHAVAAGLTVEVELARSLPAPQSLLGEIASAGATRLSIAVDGLDASTHDRHVGLVGSFALAMDALERVRRTPLSLEVRSTLHPNNFDQVQSMGQAVARWGARRWRVGPAIDAATAPSPQELERAIGQLARMTGVVPIDIHVEHAPFFYRLCQDLGVADRCMMTDERTALFVNAYGEIMPEPSIPVVVGHAAADLPGDLYRSHPLLRALRDPDAIEGKCGTCGFRGPCGGSRARARAATGSLFASDPACSYPAAS